jgi:hypothetical protein
MRRRLPQILGLCLVFSISSHAEARGPGRRDHSGNFQASEPGTKLSKEQHDGPRGSVQVEVLPQQEFELGAAMRFRVTARKSGYLILVDVDAQGKLSQIYPNMVTLSDPAGVDEKANFLSAGQSVILPGDRGEATYRFVASPPRGVGMVVAVLCGTPLQIVDLPDVPAEFAGKARAAEFIEESMRLLQLLPSDDARPTHAPKWSLATQYYRIK